MPAALKEYRFQTPFSSGELDNANGIIRGVALITGHVEAIGHDLHIDDTTLSQVLACARKSRKIPVKLNHGSGVENLCGYIDGKTCYLDGGKLRGDWHLLRTHEEYAKLMERAERMPECFGMSIAFKGNGAKVAGGRKAARCDRLVAVDCVTQPAANPDGLFSERSGAGEGRVDSAAGGMPKAKTTNPNTPSEESGEEAMPAWAQQLLGKMESIEQGHQEIADRLGPLEDFHHGVLDHLAGEGEEPAATEDDPEADPQEESAAGADPEGAAAIVPHAVSAELKALRKQVTQLAAAREEEIHLAEQERVDHAFAVVEEKVIALSEKNRELTELAERQEGEIKTLRLAVRSGTRPAAPGMAEPGMRLFATGDDGELNEFQKLVKKHEAAGKKPGEAISLAVKENPEAHQQHLHALQERRRSVRQS